MELTSNTNSNHMFAQYPDWAERDDIKGKFKVDLILLLHKYGFPPVFNDAYKGPAEQADNYKKNN